VVTYPFEAGLDYVRNGWYVAAWSSEIGDALLARRLLGEDIVFYRAASGAVVALRDRCAHRAYPLSAGVRVGDAVRCGYHGFTYDATGRCTAIPAQAHVPAAYGVRAYPILERGGAVWIWMGEAHLADAARLPDLDELGLTHPEFYTVIGGAKRWQNRYQLINENLLDLSHIEFLHPGSLGTPHVAQSPVVTTVHDGMVEAVRLIADDEPTPFHHRGVGITGRMDRTTRSLFYLPGAHVTHVTMVAPGSKASRGEPGYFGEFRIGHFITPVAPDETLYFWSFARTAKTDDETTEFFRDAFSRVFDQDGAALERQEAALRTASDFREVSCKADEAALKARRMLLDAMRSERERIISPVTRGHG
jgi:vanillate O-demethylase monooxygenase subunit